MTEKIKSVEGVVEEFRQQPYVSVAGDSWTEENRDGYLKAIDEITPWLRTTLTTRDAQIRREAFVEGVDTCINYLGNRDTPDADGCVPTLSAKEAASELEKLKQDAQEGLETKE